MTRTSSIPEKPLCQSPRKLTDWLKPDGQRKVHSMIDTVYQPKNLRAAWDKVKANRGSGGIDGQSLEAVEQGLEEHLHRLHEDLRTDRYQPLPVRRVDIPKAGKPGEWRPLGIPAGIDRVCQQALLNRLEPIFEPLFDDSSFGYRPGRSAKDALRKMWREIEAGAEWIVDADLKDYFGSIDHDKLLTWVAQRVADGRVLTLVERMLTAGAMQHGRLFPTTQGTPQGGVVSPLLSNILLTPFDREMRRRGYPFRRRKPLTASKMPAATQRSIICPPRQRLTLRFTERVRLMRLSAAFVVASERRRRGESFSVSTVSVSSRPSRTLSEALGYSVSSRRARSSSRRWAVVMSAA